ncbi:MAG TPA: hypothetical protein VM537_33050 [Anaerolineae bacterium]|nr:hypothetical protein [Anaerolineae bacterium]
MSTRSYWLNLFTWTTWQEFLEAGGKVTGFRERRWKTVQRVKPGDYLLCYLTGVSRWIAVLEVTSDAFWDEATIWNDAVFPSRLRVKLITALTPETAVPVKELSGQLSFFQNLKFPNAWGVFFRGSPRKFKPSDGEAVLNAILETERNPLTRAVDEHKLQYRPSALRVKDVGVVTMPEAEGAEQETEGVSEPTLHDSMQSLLLRLGSDMGLDVWVARNDRNRIVDGERLADLPRMRSRLPRQFDEVTQRIVELIDVLWLRENEIVAAFEIEHTTSIYSGLLRMSDLVAVQPSLRIPLYLVAPDERRDKVRNEVNRPTFSRLRPRLSQVCSFVPFSALRDRVPKEPSVVRYLKPEFLAELSESCEIEEV